MTNSEPSLFLSFVLLFIIAGFTAYYANQKRRNPVIWFFLGLLLGIIAPLILLFLSKGKQENIGLPTMTVYQPDQAQEKKPEAHLTVDEQKMQAEQNKLWYYLDKDHHQIGPVSVIALRELWNRGKLDLNQYVWSEGMEKWEKVDHLPLLKSILSKP